MLKRLPTKPGEPVKFRDDKTGEIFELRDFNQATPEEWEEHNRLAEEEIQRMKSNRPN